jgi:hypothetical protein
LAAPFPHSSTTDFNNTKLPGPNRLSARATTLTSSLSTITCPSERTAAKAPRCLDSRPFTKRSYNSSWLGIFMNRRFTSCQHQKHTRSSLPSPHRCRDMPANTERFRSGERPGKLNAVEELSRIREKRIITHFVPIHLCFFLADCLKTLAGCSKRSQRQGARKIDERRRT